MSNTTASLRGLCPAPFFQLDKFPTTGGHIEGRMCRKVFTATCCLPCPLTDWTYPDNFNDLSQVANWINVVGMICCAFLLVSWVFLPVEKTARHYLSISLTCAVVLMNLGFIIPLAAKPPQCFNEITPHNMYSSSVCAASGAFLLGGGWAGVMWVFLRSVSLHLQICWQVVVGRNFMWVSQALGWGIPIIGLIILMLLSGVSFRFGQTCHINHQNSLGDFWIPLLVFAGLTVIIQFATFGYCIKVYLVSLADSSASTEGSGLPAYSNSIRTMTPRQAYRRVRRVIQLQWRGIIIVLIIISDVIFFAVIFVFQDNTVEAVKNDPVRSNEFVFCLLDNQGNKDKCLNAAGSLVVNLPTVVAMLILLACNGLWLLLLLGRWSMVTGWIEYFASFGGNRAKKEFVSVDARMDLKKDPRSYEMLSRDSAKTESVLTPVSASKSPTTARSGRQTPDYFGQTPRYQPHSRSFSAPRPPQQQSVAWDPYTTTYGAQVTPAKTHQAAGGAQSHEMSSSFETDEVGDGFVTQPPASAYQTQYPSAYQTRQNPSGYPDMNPLGMNRI